MEMELPLGIPNSFFLWRAPNSFFLIGADFIGAFIDIILSEGLTISFVSRGEGHYTIGADFVGSQCGSYIYFLHCFLIVLCDDTLGLFHDDLVAVDNVHALLESAESLTREVIDNHLFVLATEDSLDASSCAFVVEVESVGL